MKTKEEAYEKIIDINRNNEYTTGNLLDYDYFKKYYKLIAIDLSKQQVLQENEDLIQQINFIGRLTEAANVFIIIKKKKKKPFQNFLKILLMYCIVNINMENQKIINVLNKDDTDSKHFATKKWYIINDENNTNYGVNKDTGEDNLSTIKYDTRVLKTNLCDYAEAYILVNGTIRAAAADANTRLALKNCAPFTKCNLEINDEHVDTAENLDIVMPMYNLIEYSDNYQDSPATVYQYKRDEPPEANTINDLTTDTSSSFKYKVELLGNPVVHNNIARRNVKVVVTLKYLSNFFRSLEMPLINCKIKFNFAWKKECVLSNQAGDAVFTINDTQLYVPVVTLSKEDNKDFIEKQNKGFQRSIYWNEYKTKELNSDADANVFKYINLDPSFQGVNRMFVVAYSRVDGQPDRNSQQKYYLPRIDLNKYHVIIDRKKFYDNPIESDVEKYRELKKVMIGKGEDYTTGSLYDYNYIKKHYKIVAVDLSKQKELDADPRAIQQIEFKYMLRTNSTIYWVLEKSKETILEFYKGTVKVY